jgi:lactam utilization protein B
MKNRHSIAILFSLFSVLGAGQASANFSAKDYPDLYGSALFDKAAAKGVDVAAHPGYGDNYGSILLDMSSVGTVDVAAHPGYGDSYGSILLDLPTMNRTMTVVQHTASNNSNSI